MDGTVFTLLDNFAGKVRVAWNEQGLVSVSIGRELETLPAKPDWRFEKDAHSDATEQLDAYFSGTLKQFDLPLVLYGTPFQERVWRALAGIPYGKTVSYGELAREIGRPAAVRAVGAANGKNPVPIVLPCHRVIGSDGRLTGYAGGLGLKQTLLDFERGVIPIPVP